MRTDRTKLESQENFQFRSIEICLNNSLQFPLYVTKLNVPGINSVCQIFTSEKIILLSDQFYLMIYLNILNLVVKYIRLMTKDSCRDLVRNSLSY